MFCLVQNNCIKSVCSLNPKVIVLPTEVKHTRRNMKTLISLLCFQISGTLDECVVDMC